MGSNEAATATTGGPRVIDVFDGKGAPSAQFIYFLWMQIGSWWPLGVSLVVGKRLCRTRHRCSSLVLSERPGTKLGLKIAKAQWSAERNRPKMLEAAARAV